MVSRYILKIGKIISFIVMWIFIVLTFYFLYIEKDRPLSIGCLSVAIACLSVFIAICSEKRMRALTDSDYNGQYSDLNTRRLELREKLIKYKSKQALGATRTQLLQDETDYCIYHSFSIWKCLRYLKSIVSLNEFLSPEQRGEVIHEIDCLYQDLGDGKAKFNITIDNNYKEQCQKMYELISEFDIFNADTIRVQRMQNNLGFLRDAGPNNVVHFS